MRNGQRHKRKDHCQIGYLLKRYCTANREKNPLPSIIYLFFFFLSLYIVFLKDYITQTNLLIHFPFMLKGFWKTQEDRSEFK